MKYHVFIDCDGPALGDTDAGPFDTREEAEHWADREIRRHGLFDYWIEEVPGNVG